MPGEIVSIEENERGKLFDINTSEDEKRRTRARSLRRRAANASTKLTHSLKKRTNRVADCRYAGISIEDVRDTEEEKAVNAFRQALIAKDFLLARHDDYHTMLRFLKARKFDVDKTVQMWAEMLNWRIHPQSLNCSLLTLLRLIPWTQNMGKKKFIDKKKAATFQLLARDSSDPNYNDSSGSDRIFVRVDNGNISVNSFFNDDGDDGNAIFSDAPEDNDGGDDDDRVFGNSTAFNGGIAGPGSGTGLPEHVRREILELGFPDDGYNYLIHLREIKNTGGGSAFYHNPKARLDQLPHDVKAYDASRLQISHVKGDSDEKSIYGVASGAVNVRVQKAVDPDVTALLDDSDLSRFGSDVEDLEEDFVVQANLPEEGGKDLDIRNKLTLVEELEATNEVDYPTFSRHDNAFRLVDLDEEKKQSTSAGDNFASEKTRVHRLLDEQFDLLELQEYGCTSDDDYDDYVAEEEEDSLAMKLKNSLNDHAVDDIELDEKYVGPADLLHKNEKAQDKELLESAADVIRRCVEYAEKYENENEDEEVVVVQESSDESEQWDCETIVSTYSNLDNRPGKIEAPGIAMKKKLAETVSGSLHSSSNVISLRGKEKLPIDFLPPRKTDKKEIKDVCSLKIEPLKRKPRGQESKDEKRERKAAVREKRREALRIKKETSELYKETARHAQRVAAISGPSSIHLM